MIKSVAASLAYLGTIPAANYLIANLGSIPGHEIIGGFCIENGPCMLPMGFGLAAPAGVLMVGVGLFLRDQVQTLAGKRVALLMMALGILLSFWINPALGIASAVAFGASELLDFAVFTPLKARNLGITAIVASGVVGSVVDSVLFLLLAFGSLDFVVGQIVGKLYMTVGLAGLYWLFTQPRKDVQYV